MPLCDLDVFVVDCQTTGATPELGEVLEIGWAWTSPSRAFEGARSYRVALTGGRKIPRVVRRLTGLSDATLADAIPPGEAWRLLRSEAGEALPVPTVIHFARFELAFLRDLAARFEPAAPAPFDVVCAHEIARRLFPDLPRRGLRALAGYFGHGLELERRSGGHVEATALVWRHLAAELEARGVREWGDLRPWLEAPPRPSTGRRAYPLPRERRLALPDAPGVYRFMRSNGDVLYVGKATSLRKRVSSHFTVGRSNERALEMLTQARDIEVTVTESTLEAALLETDEIKRLDPPYNIHLRAHERSAWFASQDLAEAVAVVEQTGHRIGPLPSRHALAALSAVRVLVAGEPPTLALRARAVGVPPAFGPDEASFAAGWALFVERRLAPMRSRTPWGRLLKASKVLWRLFGEGALDESPEDGPREWDPERVRRHLELRVLGGGQLLRRSRWLCLLADSSVAWREQGAASWRVLVISGAEITAQRDLADSEAVPVPPGTGRTWRERQRAFDAIRYDRLRVLSTELKRVHAESGDVAVRIGRRELRGESLSRLLRWV